jgi:hypothetical protein
MSFFKELNAEERDLIISLPYRVGHWISQVDDMEKTKRDDKWEKAALDQAIRKIARQNAANSLTRAVMTEVDNNRMHWQQWATKCEDEVLFSDIGLALDLVRLKIHPKALPQYKKVLWYMALVVAQAFGEDDDPDQEMHINHLFADLKKMLFATPLGKNPENISDIEKTALKKLRAALKS